MTNVDFHILGRPRMTLPIAQVANNGICICIFTVVTNVDFYILGRPRMTLPITQVANYGIGMKSGHLLDIRFINRELLNSSNTVYLYSWG